MARPNIEQALGTDDVHRGVVKGSNGLPITTYTAGNALTSELWSGDDLAILASPAVAWEDPAAGSYTLTVAQADIAGLGPGSYRLRLFVAESGARRRPILDVDLKLTAAPGAGTPSKAYGTSDQMAAYFPGLDKLQSDSDQTGFAEQRSLAREWIDRAIIARWPGGKQAIRAILDGGGLLATGQVVEIAAKKALSIVLAAQLPDAATVAAGRPSAYQQAGVRFAAEAEALLTQLAAEIDADADGEYEEVVDCGGPPTTTSGGFVMSTATRHRRRGSC